MKFMPREMNSHCSGETAHRLQASHARSPLDKNAAVIISVPCHIGGTFMPHCAGVQLSPAARYVPRGVPAVSRKGFKGHRTPHASRGFAAGTGHPRLAGSGKLHRFRSLNSAPILYIAASTSLLGKYICMQRGKEFCIQN